MLQCDRCVIGEAKHHLRLYVGKSEIHKWALCGGCLNLVCSETQKIVRDYQPEELKEFCPSLTSDQAKQVELYLKSKEK